MKKGEIRQQGEKELDTLRLVSVHLDRMLLDAVSDAERQKENPEGEKEDRKAAVAPADARLISLISAVSRQERTLRRLYDLPDSAEKEKAALARRRLALLEKKAGEPPEREEGGVIMMPAVLTEAQRASGGDTVEEESQG